MVTDYQLNRRERMNEYLDSLKEEAIRINGDESVIWLAKDFLTLLINKLVQQNKILEVPDCEPDSGNDDEFCVLFSWHKDEHYLECVTLDISKGKFEFFYDNCLIGEDWRENFIIGQPFSEALIEKLSLFVE